MPPAHHSRIDTRSIELAGFAAAHAICCVFDRQPLAPLAFSRRGPDTVILSVMPGGKPPEVAARGTRWLDANVDGADAAVVVYDAYLTIEGVRSDALLLEIRSYAPPAASMRIAVPYRPHHHPGGFAVHRPKFIVSAIEDENSDALTWAFFRGVFSHDPGGRMWEACADQSR